MLRKTYLGIVTSQICTVNLHEGRLDKEYKSLHLQRNCVSIRVSVYKSWKFRLNLENKEKYFKFQMYPRKGEWVDGNASP